MAEKGRDGDLEGKTVGLNSPHSDNHEFPRTSDRMMPRNNPRKKGGEADAKERVAPGTSFI